jgi:hypothetical protein
VCRLLSRAALFLRLAAEAASRPRHRAQPRQGNGGTTSLTDAEVARLEPHRRGLDLVQLVVLAAFELTQKFGHGSTRRLVGQLPGLGRRDTPELLVRHRHRVQEPSPSFHEELTELADPVVVEPWPGHDQSALIGMVVPLAAGVLGSVTVSSPFLKAAVTLLPSTPTGSRTLRAKLP